MISFSVAIEPNKGIGLNGVMPWHLKDELKIFKRNTLNHKIIMGRTTVEGLPRKLVDRIVYAVSKDESYVPKFDDVIVIHDLEAFVKEHKDDEEEYIICGGATIYKQTYQYCTKGYVSFVKNSYDYDTSFDCFDLNDWQITLEEDHEDFIYRELIRK